MDSNGLKKPNPCPIGSLQESDPGSLTRLQYLSTVVLAGLAGENANGL